MNEAERQDFWTDTRAQLTVVGLLLMFLTLITMSYLMPQIISASLNMSTNLSANGFTYEALLAKLPPMFLIVAFLATIAMYAGPQIR